MLQFLIYVAIQAYLWHTYLEKPGSDLEFHLFDNVGLITDVTNHWRFYPILLGACALSAYKWRVKPQFLRIGLLVTAIPLVSAAIFFGMVDEMRDYYEAVPFIFLLVCPTVADVFGIAWSCQDHGVKFSSKTVLPSHPLS